MTVVYERFLAFRRIPLKVVFVTLLASWAMQIGAILQGQPLYVIVFFTLLPWVPLAFFEGIWKYKHYNWIAIFAVVAVLQVGHYGEHLVQVTELGFLNGTLACPPPVDNGDNAQRAVDLGLRSDTDATGYRASYIVKPDQNGQPETDANGSQIIGPPACGVFGQFDFEPIHLVWDTLVWIGGLLLLAKFPRNTWLWVAVAFASLHEVEHLFLGWTYLVEPYFGSTYPILGTQWATTADGNIVTAHPAGKETINVDFYHAGGLTGIVGKNGLVENLLGTSGRFPLRPYLHFIYNSLVVIPTVIAFLVQARRAYDEYLAEALPWLSEEQLIETTPKLERQSYEPGSVIVRQGDDADTFYIITKGQVEVLREQDGQEIVVSRLGSGQYFGEIGLLHGGKRTATVRAADDVEVMALDRSTFSGLVDESDMGRQEMDRLIRQRVRQLQALRSGG